MFYYINRFCLNVIEKGIKVNVDVIDICSCWRWLISCIDVDVFKNSVF